MSNGATTSQPPDQPAAQPEVRRATPVTPNIPEEQWIRPRQASGDPAPRAQRVQKPGGGWVNLNTVEAEHAQALTNAATHPLTEDTVAKFRGIPMGQNEMGIALYKDPASGVVYKLLPGSTPWSDHRIAPGYEAEVQMEEGAYMPEVDRLLASGNPWTGQPYDIAHMNKDQKLQAAAQANFFNTTTPMSDVQREKLSKEQDILENRQQIAQDLSKLSDKDTSWLAQQKVKITDLLGMSPDQFDKAIGNNLSLPSKQAMVDYLMRLQYAQAQGDPILGQRLPGGPGIGEALGKAAGATAGALIKGSGLGKAVSMEGLQEAGGALGKSLDSAFSTENVSRMRMSLPGLINQQMRDYYESVNTMHNARVRGLDQPVAIANGYMANLQNQGFGRTDNVLNAAPIPAAAAEPGSEPTQNVFDVGSGLLNPPTGNVPSSVNPVWQPDLAYWLAGIKKKAPLPPAPIQPQQQPQQ